MAKKPEAGPPTGPRGQMNIRMSETEAWMLAAVAFDEKLSLSNTVRKLIADAYKKINRRKRA